MKKIIIAWVIVLSTTVFCNAQQQAQIIKWNTLEQILKNKADTTYVINFWATWCKPCVAELPYFIDEEKKTSDKPVKFYFISLDFKKELVIRLIPFIEKQNIGSTVYLLDEPDYNSWIDKVDSTWGGAIPATLVFNNAKGVHHFYEKDFAKEELEQTLKTYIQ